MTTQLPPGQIERASMPRFGLDPFADRFPTVTDAVSLEIAGDVHQSFTLNDPFADISRIDLTADFHCVTTWSVCNVTWSGYRFADLFHTVLAPRTSGQIEWVILRCQDGFRAALPLVDMLQPDVLLADQQDGAPLTIAHGAPLRLVAPAHYGYKNPKHVNRIELWTDERAYRPPGLRFMDHPRARVAQEERGRIFPGRLLRVLYRPLIARTAKRFQRALDAHLAKR